MSVYFVKYTGQRRDPQKRDQVMCIISTLYLKKGDTPPSYDDEWYNHISEFSQLLQDIKLNNVMADEDMSYTVMKKQKTSTRTHHSIIAPDKIHILPRKLSNNKTPVTAPPSTS